ncbi:MAG: hypothetical protein ACYSW3_02280 [Planctomycetota bacterium]|jgi:hypothetical protein
MAIVNYTHKYCSHYFLVPEGTGRGVLPTGGGGPPGGGVPIVDGELITERTRMMHNHELPKLCQGCMYLVVRFDWEQTDDMSLCLDRECMRFRWWNYIVYLYIRMRYRQWRYP